MYKWFEVILLVVIPLAWALAINAAFDAILRPTKPPKNDPPQEPSS